MPKAANTRPTCAISFGDPTRMAPWRSAVTREMLPKRSASGPLRLRKSSLTSVDTSTRVLYAGTSSPYMVDNLRANSALSCHSSRNDMGFLSVLVVSVRCWVGAVLGRCPGRTFGSFVASAVAQERHGGNEEPHN